MANRYVWERYSQNTSYSLSWRIYRPSGDGIPIGRGTWRLARSCWIDNSTGSVSFSGSRDFNGDISADDYPYLYRSGYTSGTGTISLYRASTQGSGGKWTQAGLGEDTQAYVNESNLDHYSRASISQSISQGGTNYGPVTNASSGAYPNNGSSGGRWYVYHGSDTIDPASVTIPASIQGGTSIDITVAPSTGKKYGGTVYYTYQYKLDNGRWQALSGPTTATTQQLTVPKGTASVQVQVRAQDNLGFTSSTWVASASVEVTNNQPPTAPGSINVANVVSGQEATITLTAATDPDGSIASYIYQRSVDSGMWQQFAQANTLTQTDTVSNSWGTVQYRACAVDNEGAQGPFATSTLYTVTSGLLVIGGPNPSLGELDRQFKLALNINVTGVPSLTDIDVQATLDGAGIYTGQVDSGGVATIPVDARLLYTGAHTIRVTISHDDYEPATAEYTFTVPTVSMPDGGRALVGQTPDGEPAFFYTTSQSVFCQGGTLADVLVTMQGGSAAPLLEPVVKAAPPSGSYALSPGVLYDFTQADASALTFTFEAPAAGKAAAYHVMFKSGRTAATVTLPAGVRTPDGYVIEANRVYELSILQNMLAYQSWGAS